MGSWWIWPLNLVTNAFFQGQKWLAWRLVYEGAVLRKLLGNGGTGAFAQRELVFNLFSRNSYIKATNLDLTQRVSDPRSHRAAQC